MPNPKVNREMFMRSSISTNEPFVSDGFSVNLITDGLGHFIGATTGGANKIWTVRNGVWAVAAGKMNCSNVGGDTGRITIDAGSVNYVVETTLYAAGGVFGFMLRYVDANNYIKAYIDYPNVRIITRVGGVENTLLDVAIGYVDAQQLRFVLNGNKIDAWYGGTLGGTGGNGGPVGAQQTIVDAVLMTSPLVGLISSNVGNAFDNFSVWPISTWNRIHHPGGVIWTFDDEFAGAMSKIPYSYGKIRGTMYVRTDHVNTGGYATVAELLAMQAAGFAIENHTVDCGDLTGLNQALQEAQMTGAKTALNAWGLTGGVHLAFPGGTSNADTLLAMAATGTLTGRTTVGGSVASRYTTPSRLPATQAKLVGLTCVLMTIDTTTLANIQALVNKAVGSNSYVIILTHDIKDAPVGVNETATAVFNDAVDWIVAQGIDTATIGDLYNWVMTGF